MARDTLTGSRIRERRIASGVKQAELAREAGISASYLNLIEHNRRRIGGKLLLRIAEVLQVDAGLLADGAGVSLIEALREAASDMPGAGAEQERVDEFAGRFPGWAQLLADSRGRIAALERTIETLTDRMTHDPHLAASLHEMLSTVTAIRSAATILAEPGDIEPEWQARFHRNIFEDSARLADTSRGLVSYLEADERETTRVGSPQEEMDDVLEELSHHVADLEQPQSDLAAISKELGKGLSAQAAALLQEWLSQYQKDAQAMPQDAVLSAVQDHGLEVGRLAVATGLAPSLLMRRLAAMPDDALPQPVGLAICDSSGFLRYRKPLADFPMPKFGAACPLWPLYRALSRPMVLLQTPIEQTGRQDARFLAETVAEPIGPIAVARDPLFEAHMLITRDTQSRDASVETPLGVGVTCRICAKVQCPARREPSILATST